MRLTVRVAIRETARGIKVCVREFLPFVWLPKKCVSPPLKAGDRDVEVTIPSWLDDMVMEQLDVNAIKRLK